MEVIYKDKNFIALNKPAGVLVHGDKKHLTDNEGQEMVVDWLIKNYPEVKNVGDSGQAIQERPGIVHRLDKGTSGVLLIPLNQKFFDHLKKLFQSHEVKKTYLALVLGELSGKGVINKPIGLRPGSVKRSTEARNMKMVKEAITEYQVIKNFEKDGKDYTLVELIPKTGRTHQLRIHLASINHPIVGDPLYRPQDNPWSLKRQFLHAEKIEFSGEGGKRFRIEADLPEELKKIINNLNTA